MGHQDKRMGALETSPLQKIRYKVLLFTYTSTIMKKMLLEFNFKFLYEQIKSDYLIW